MKTSLGAYGPPMAPTDPDGPTMDPMAPDGPWTAPDGPWTAPDKLTGQRSADFENDIYSSSF